jgi:excisionase family DNA binding protein
VTRELLTINQACARAKVSRRTVQKWLQSGKIDFVRTAGGSPRIFADTLLMREVIVQRTEDDV